MTNRPDEVYVEDEDYSQFTETDVEPIEVVAECDKCKWVGSLNFDESHDLKTVTEALVSSHRIARPRCKKGSLNFNF